MYYGSTITSLAERLKKHKSVGNHCSSRELFDAGVVSIELVEEYPCNSKHELLSRERIYIEFMLNNFTHRVICNKQIPTRTQKERSREYHEDNKDAINKKSSEKVNCDCGSIVRRSDKARHLKTKKHLAYINSPENEMSKKN